MAPEQIAAAMQRLESVLRRRPGAGLEADLPALARWDGGLRTVVHHDNGHALVTDMPPEIGGQAGQMSPGWLLRAALASCAVTRIAMSAAAAGIVLHTLHARASSRSDARGLMAVAAADGSPVPAGPDDVQLQVCIGATGVPAERLRALVQASAACSPVSAALEQAVPVALHIEIAGG